MDTTTELEPRQQGAQRPDTVIAATLAVLAECDGSTRECARQTGIPESTIRDWRDGNYRTCPAQLAQQMKTRRAAKWDAIQDAGTDQALAKLPEASAYQAALIAAIAFDKAATSRGEATSVVEHRDDARVKLLQERYGKLRAARQLAPTHAQDGTPLPPANAETLENKGNEGE